MIVKSEQVENFETPSLHSNTMSANNSSISSIGDHESSTNQAQGKTVRILLVGEKDVGKTSMVYSLIFEEFHDVVPSKCEEILIPPEITPVNISSEIVDYSAKEQSEEDLVKEIQKASVICIVYAMNNELSIDKISTYWLPFIRSTLGYDHETPVILVGNKSDLVESYNSMDSVLPLMNQYKEVEICVECSAKSLDNLSEIFYYAQKTVLYPVTPIYSPEERDLTENCKIALRRVFKLCDLDNDGVLNDFELNQFQTFCFGSFLLSQTLDEVKYILKSIIPDGVLDNGITLSGFLFLLTFFIQRGRHELIWLVLRKYGYNNSVQLGHDYLVPEIKCPHGSTVELSPQGLSFFTSLFAKYDRDGDGALSGAELANLMSMCPGQSPLWARTNFHHLVPTNGKGWITLQGFLSIWTLSTSINLDETLKYLAIFGYMATTGEKDQLSAVYITKDKRIDLDLKHTSRNVFSCHVIGPSGSGKTCFTQRFIGNSNKAMESSSNSTSANVYQRHVANAVTVYDQKKYLIMKEIDVDNVDVPLEEPELVCDVVCLMFDQSQKSSFEKIAKIYVKNFLNTKLPVLVVAAKSDCAAVQQDFHMQPEEFCTFYKLTPLHKFSSLFPDFDSLHSSSTSSSSSSTSASVSAYSKHFEVYEKLATMAAYPNLNRLVHLMFTKPTSSWMVKNIRVLHRFLPQDRLSLLQTGFGVVSIALVGLFIMRLLKVGASPGGGGPPGIPGGPSG